MLLERMRGSWWKVSRWEITKIFPWNDLRSRSKPKSSSKITEASLAWKGLDYEEKYYWECRLTMKEEVIDQTPKRMYFCRVAITCWLCECRTEVRNICSDWNKEKRGCRTHKSRFILDQWSKYNRKSPCSIWSAWSTTCIILCYLLFIFQGSSVKAGTCETCGLSQQHCIGHFGFIKLALPVFHIGYFKNTLNLCQCICKVKSTFCIP